VIATIAGFLTPGYDAVSTTISRLAVPGAPAALPVDVAIALVALSCLGLALALERARRTGRIAFAAAGTALAIAALIHLDPASDTSTWAHRAASGLAVAGLTVAPLALARDYGAVCLVAGLAEVAMVGIAAVLLATPFDAWGLWERALVAIPLTWMVLIAFTRPSTQDTPSAKSAILSRSGSYAPETRVTSAKP
jgi:hypothetical protein